jgi:hypothetical protein
MSKMKYNSKNKINNLITNNSDVFYNEFTDDNQGYYKIKINLFENFKDLYRDLKNHLIDINEKFEVFGKC